MQGSFDKYCALDLTLVTTTKDEGRLVFTSLEDFHKLLYHCSGNTRREIGVCCSVYGRASLVLLQADAFETLDVEAEILPVGDESFLVIFVETLMGFLSLNHDVLDTLGQCKDVSFQTGTRGSARPNADEDAFAVRPQVIGLSVKKSNGVVVA